MPYTRGEEVSRKPRQIFDEVARLAEQGVKEIVFVGQNVNSYKYSESGRILGLADLIQISAEINGIERIRYTTSHPLDMSNDLIEIYKYVPQLVDHLHLPVQSGSDKVLLDMKRNYSFDDYLSIIQTVSYTHLTLPTILLV